MKKESLLIFLFADISLKSIKKSFFNSLITISISPDGSPLLMGDGLIDDIIRAFFNVKWL